MTDDSMSPHPRSTPELANEVLNDVTLLMKSEGELARAEINESLSQAMAGIASLLIAVGIIIAGLTIVLLAIGTGMVGWFGMDLWLAQLIMGVLALVIGAVLVGSAKAALKPENLAPTRTARNIKKDARVVQESMK